MSAVLTCGACGGVQSAAVCARRRADRRGPKTPGAGPGGSGQEIRAGGAGPLAAGWTDQRGTLARVWDLVTAKFGEQYTVPGIWYLLRRRDWTS